MKLRIRKGLFAWSLIDESGETAAKISNQKFIGAAKKISDGKGNIIFTTDIINFSKDKEDWNWDDSKKYIIYKDAVPVATATLSFTEKTESAKSQNFKLRPPRVEKMDLETPDGIWIIQRQKNHSLIITYGDVQLGSVTPFFSLKPVYFECTERYDAVFWAGIYVLIEYMMHEDDLIVV